MGTPPASYGGVCFLLIALCVGALIGGNIGFFESVDLSRLNKLGPRLLPTAAVQGGGCGNRSSSLSGQSWTVADPVQLAACIDEVLPNLPLVGSQGCRPASHHWDAQTGKWNEQIRFQPLALSPAAIATLNMVLYIGGNTNAADVAGLQGLLPGRAMHVLEPVPTFYAQLSRLARPGLTTHQLGLANSTRNVSLPKSALHGQSTVVMNATGGGGAGEFETLQLVSPLDFLARVGLNPAKDQALLHVNCEGCEYEMFEALLDEGIIRMFPVIQWSFHFVPEVPYAFTRYCSVRVRLSETHKAVISMPYGWERWVRKDLLQG